MAKITTDSSNMGDFLKSAMNYFNTVPVAGTENEFIGQVIEVQALKLRIKRLIAEGECRSNFFSLIRSLKRIFFEKNPMKSESLSVEKKLVWVAKTTHIKVVC